MAKGKICTFCGHRSADEKYYMKLYDDIIIPDLGDVHYKRAITERNRWRRSNRI